MNKILSVIIPTYNMEKYLRKCLDSLIINNRDLLEKLEVLVVNDGSKDSSSSIAHEYKAKYPSVVSVIDKENGNYGSCVNRGLKEATGKYIKILDADDSFNKKSLEEHLNFLESTNVDLVLTSFIEERKVNRFITYPLEPFVEYDFEEICIQPGVIEAQMHAVTYKTENLKRINYKQTEGISYTDQEWIFIPMTTIRKVVYQPIFLYRYLIGREGQTMSDTNIDRSFPQQILCAKNRLKDLKERNISLSNNQKTFLFHNLSRVITYIYRAVVLRGVYNIEELKSLDSYIKDMNIDFYRYIENEDIIILGYKFKYIRYFRMHHSAIPKLYQNLYLIIYKAIHPIYMYFLYLKRIKSMRKL